MINSKKFELWTKKYYFKVLGEKQDLFKVKSKETEE